MSNLEEAEGLHPDAVVHMCKEVSREAQALLGVLRNPAKIDELRDHYQSILKLRPEAVSKNFGVGETRNVTDLEGLRLEAVMIVIDSLRKYIIAMGKAVQPESNIKYIEGALNQLNGFYIYSFNNSGKFDDGLTRTHTTIQVEVINALTDIFFALGGPAGMADLKGKEDRGVNEFVMVRFLMDFFYRVKYEQEHPSDNRHERNDSVLKAIREAIDRIDQEFFPIDPLGPVTTEKVEGTAEDPRLAPLRAKYEALDSENRKYKGKLISWAQIFNTFPDISHMLKVGLLDNAVPLYISVRWRCICLVFADRPIPESDDESGSDDEYIPRFTLADPHSVNADPEDKRSYFSRIYPQFTEDSINSAFYPGACPAFLRRLRLAGRARRLT
ncbi:MAG: hypothetical protein WC882_01095 [Candidatus Gracilibacteria bacterium]